MGAGNIGFMGILVEKGIDLSDNYSIILYDRFLCKLPALISGNFVSFQDRQYYREPVSEGGGFRPNRPTASMFFPSLTPWVKYLMIINVVVFVLQIMTRTYDPELGILIKDPLADWLAARGQPPLVALQIWRLITFQFLHGDFGHLLFNMIGFYFFGTAIERTMGSKRFIYFYLTCGVVGGLIFVISTMLGFYKGGYLVGASGGLLGLMAAMAIYYPKAKVYLYFLFPIPIRVLILVITVLYTLNILRGGSNAGGDLCHLGGMATGFVWLLGRGHFNSLWQKQQQGAFRRKQEDEAKLQFEVDRILAKVKEHGMQSLTRKEQDTLRRATKQQG
ncbi:MAG: rhomboid family intramembrane serine protease [Planctomycetes bacterium]|nr:rhomboid family intramembrane serine protease [Planctomycetota bacterium]